MRIFEAMQALLRRKQFLLASAACLLVVLCALAYYMNTQKTIIIINEGNIDELSEASDFLVENNIAAELSNGGTALAVPKQSADDAKLLLAANFTFTPTFTYEIALTEDLDENTREQSMLRVKENVIAKAIEAIEGVEDARVLLSIPDTSTSETASVPCASVVLDAPNGLTDKQLDSIAEYISKCVVDLTPENVAIAQPDGNVIYSEGKVRSSTEPAV